MRAVIILLLVLYQLAAWGQVVPTYAGIVGAQRVISLAPNLTELVYALGAEEKLVGRTLYCTYPEAAQNLPVIGSFFRPELEKIAVLKPDLCLAIKGGTPELLLRQLERLEIQVLMLELDQLSALAPEIIRLGKALDCQQKAQELAVDIEKRITAVEQEAFLRGKGKPAPAVLFQIHESPLIFAGPDSYIGEMISKAGGDIPLEPGTLYPRIAPERVIMLRPEVILVAGMGGSNSAEDEPAGFLQYSGKAMAESWNHWPSLPAVSAHRIHVVDPDAFSRPSLRSLEALELLLDWILPPVLPENFSQAGPLSFFDRHLRWRVTA